MKLIIKENARELGAAAGSAVASIIKEAIDSKGEATVILATGASQFETLAQLVKETAIDWGKVTMFHLDEYIGLPPTHPAGFRKYLQERFIDKVIPLKSIHLIDGEADPQQECTRLEKLIKDLQVDVTLVGIGENGHLAFNDPPADIETVKPFIVVDLDENCRKQQVNEGWFKEVDDVPRQAISISIHQIMKSKHIVCSVPDARKATAVEHCLTDEINNMNPSGFLRKHPCCQMYLDKHSASLLQNVPDMV